MHIFLAASVLIRKPFQCEFNRVTVLDVISSMLLSWISFFLSLCFHLNPIIGQKRPNPNKSAHSLYEYGELYKLHSQQRSASNFRKNNKPTKNERNKTKKKIVKWKLLKGTKWKTHIHKHIHQQNVYTLKKRIEKKHNCMMSVDCEWMSSFHYISNMFVLAAFCTITF